MKWDFYGLNERPFQLTPDPAFYFESATHRKALSYLGYGLAQGEGFVVITGEIGAGKSTLVAHLMATIDPARLTAAQVVTSRLDAEEIVHVVAQAFGLIIDGHDKASALGALEDFLHEEARAGRRCLLVVDESQNLSIEALEELRMLSNFQLGAHPLLQTLLLGQPEFRDTLLDHPELEQLRQRVIATYHLQAIEPKEVQPYIEHRLNCAGWDGIPSFDQRVFAEIYDTTGGIPRRINQIVNRLLLLGSVEERTRIDGAMLQQVMTELDEDGTIALLRAAPPPRQEPAAPEPVEETAPAQIVETEVEAPEAEIVEFVAESAEESEDEGADAEFGGFVVPGDDLEENESAETAGFESEAESEESESVEVSGSGEVEADEDDAIEANSPERINFTQPFENPPALDSQDGSPMDIAEILAEQGAQIAALRQAVYDLADAANEAGKASREAGSTDLGERIAAMESRLLEQDLTIRHTLTMLIEWIESGESGREAA